MSGHSKWSQIKRQKGTTDAKRGQAFTKLAKAIMVAVSSSGVGDPEQNFKLRLLMDKARAINMPKENIERAIDKGLGKGGKDFTRLDEVVYEGFAPGGVAFIVEALTDNKKRTTPEVKSVIEKNGGTLGNPGSVAYQFHTKGEILVVKSGKTFDDIFLVAVDAGAEDVDEVGDTTHVLISTTAEALGKVRDALVLAGMDISEAELVRKPITTVLIENARSAQSVLSFMDKLENLDDVQKVYSNCDIPEHFIGE